MLAITTKLRRLKVLRTTASIILLPFRLPLMLFYVLGKGAEFIDGLIFQSGYSYVEKWIVKKGKWNDVAKKQYESNPKKFKY